MKVFKMTAVLVFAIGYSLDASAYLQDTHELLSTEAFDQSIITATGRLSEIGVSLNHRFPDQTVLNVAKKPRDLIKIGAFEEDTWLRPLNHFYDPRLDKGLNDSLVKRSYVWVIEWDGDVLTGNMHPPQEYSYRDARKYLYQALTASGENERNNNFGKTFRALGQVLHHVQDMGQPQHVRNDVHCDSPICKGLDIILGTNNIYEPSARERYTSRIARDNPKKIKLTGYDKKGSVDGNKSVQFKKPTDYLVSLNTAGLPIIPNGPRMASYTSEQFVTVDTNYEIVYTNGVEGIKAEIDHPLPTGENITHKEEELAINPA